MPNCMENDELFTDSRHSFRCGSETDIKSRETSQKLIVSGKPKVFIVCTVPGEIAVKSGNQAEVIIDLDFMNPEDMDWNISQKDNQVYIKCHSKGKSYSEYILGAPFAKILVKVPVESDLDIKTLSDRILLTGIHGHIVAESSDAKIRMHGCEGIIEVKNKTGPINLENCEGSIVVKNQNGHIKLENVNGNVSAHNSTGIIRFSGILSNGQNSFSTSTGKVDIRLLGKPDLTVVASTTLGNIKCEPEIIDARYDRGLCTCRIGTGTGKLIAKTNTGLITISR